MFEKSSSRFILWGLAFCLGFALKIFIGKDGSSVSFSSDQEVKRSHYSSNQPDQKTNDKNPDEMQKEGSESSQQRRQPAASQSPANTPGTIPDRLMAYLASKGTGTWKARTSPNGDIYRLTGGRIEGVGESREKLSDFVSGFAETLGIPSNQVLGKIETDNLRSSKIFDALQTYQGLEVFQSWLRLMTDKNTGEAYLINNKLKILEPDIDTQVNFDRDDAYDVLLSHHGNEFKKVKREWGPVVWADTSPHQLAYVFIVQTNRTTYRSVVGALSEEVLTSDQVPMH